MAGPDVRMPEFAPFAVLAFLGTGLLVFGALVGGAIALVFRKLRIARWIAAGGLLVVGGYAALLLASSFLSRDKTLRPGGKKYFCEIDCHLAYSVLGASTAKVLGRQPQLVAASGTYQVVTVRTWFDETTIASFRGYAPLTPNPRMTYLVDTAGSRYAFSPAGQKAWEDEHGPTTPLSKELRPGESYETTLVFDLPDGVRNPRLFLGDPFGVENVLIGHENSPLHGKIYLALQGRAS
ncbi:MAG: hypothetical protein ACRD00_04365 [Thermoanaerobaculia bacterium]